MNSYPAPFIIPAGAIIYSQLLLVYSVESARLSPPVSKRFNPDLLNYSTMICTTPESDLLPSLNFFFASHTKELGIKVGMFHSDSILEKIEILEDRYFEI